MKTDSDHDTSSMKDLDVREHKSGIKPINERVNFMLKLEEKKTTYTII